MVRQAVIVLALFGGGLAWAEDVRDRVSFGRNCTVYRSPSLESRPACRGTKGRRVNRATSNKKGYYRVEMDSCVGYVTDSCLSFERRRWKSRRPSALVSSGENRVRLGLGGEVGNLFGRASGVSSSGVGFGAALVLDIPLSSRFRLSLMPQYRFLQLSLTVDGSGVVSDTPGEYTQRIPHAGVGLIGSFLVSRRSIGGDPSWWLDGGMEYLVPLSGRQEDRLGNVVTFEPQDRPLFLVLGVSSDFWLSRNFNIVAYLHCFYNVAATGNSRILGARLLVNFAVHL